MEKLPVEITALFKSFGIEEVPSEGPVVPVKKLVEIAQALKDAGYLYFVYCAATHYPTKGDEKEHIVVAYRVRKVGPGSHTVPFKVVISPEEKIPSLWKVWAGADWEEREQFDMVGVQFTDHPDHRRILMPEDWDGHPLRRDYAIDTPHFPWR